MRGKLQLNFGWCQRHATWLSHDRRCFALQDYALLATVFEDQPHRVADLDS
jgi:hypothetical protein